MKLTRGVCMNFWSELLLIVFVMWVVFVLFTLAEIAKRHGKLANMWFCLWIILIITIASTLSGFAIVF